MPPRALEGESPPPPDVVRVESGERVLETLRPHWLMIFLRRPRVWISTLVTVLLLWFNPWGFAPWWVGALLLLALLFWETLEWLSRKYLLTDRRVIGEGGVLRRVLVDVRLTNIQHSALEQSLVERFLGLGTVGFASSGTGGYDVIWIFLVRPDGVLERARVQLDTRDTGLDMRA